MSEHTGTGTPPPASVQKDNGAHLDLWQAIDRVDNKVDQLRLEIAPMQEIADDVKAIRAAFGWGWAGFMTLGKFAATLGAICGAALGVIVLVERL